MKIKKMGILLAVLCAFTACENKKKEPAPESVPQIEIMGYRPAEIRLADDFDRIISIDTNVGDVYIFGQLKTGGYSGYTTDNTFSEYESFSFIPQKNETVISSALLPFGKKAVLTYLDDKTMIYIYGKDGVQQKAIECGELLESPDINADVIPCGRENYIININNIRLANIDNSGYISDIAVNGDILGVARGADNTVNYFTENSINTISFEDNKTNTRVKNAMIDSEVYASCMSEKYTCVCVLEDGLYGISDKNTKKITDFANMDFKPSEVTAIIETNDGYAVNVNGMIYFITEDDITELSKKKIIWVASYGYSNLDRYVQQYNEKQDEYKVNFREYRGNISEALQLDIISGNAPDIIPFNGFAPPDSYGKNSGLFADMYTFIDNDPELSRADFFPNILAGLESDGKLLQMGTSFIIDTIPTSSDTGIPENWTVDDMIKTYENLKENETLFPYGQLHVRTSAFDSLFDSSMYIDYENATCSFDSPDFVKYLEFFQKNEILLTFEEFDNSSPYASEEEAMKNPLISPYGNIYGVDSLHQMAKGQFKDKMVWAGSVGDGIQSGSSINMVDLYGISAVSPNIDGAWDFFRTLFSELKTDGYTHYAIYFPVLVNEFDKQIEQYTRDKVYVDGATGKTVIEKREYCDEEIENFTPEECEYYKNKIMSLRIRNIDYTIGAIINEAVFDYYEHDGDAEQTAKKIQKSVSEYLDKHYK